MGNIFRLPIVEPPSVSDALHELKHDYGFHLVAATETATENLLPMPRPANRLAIVVGNEAHGLTEELLGLCDRRVAIPMSGATDSLNVAQATAVLLYQFTRVSPACPPLHHE